MPSWFLTAFMLSLCSFPLSSVASYLSCPPCDDQHRSRLKAGLTWCQRHLELQIQEVHGAGDQRDGGQVAEKERSVSYSAKVKTLPRLATASATQPGERRQRLPRINYSFAHKRCYTIATTLIGVTRKYKGEGGEKKKPPRRSDKSDQTKRDFPSDL